MKKKYLKASVSNLISMVKNVENSYDCFKCISFFFFFSYHQSVYNMYKDSQLNDTGWGGLVFNSELNVKLVYLNWVIWKIRIKTILPRDGQLVKNWIGLHKPWLNLSGN